MALYLVFVVSVLQKHDILGCGRGAAVAGVSYWENGDTYAEHAQNPSKKRSLKTAVLKIRCHFVSKYGFCQKLVRTICGDV